MKKLARLELKVVAYVVYDAEANHAPTEALLDIIKERLGRDIECDQYQVTRYSDRTALIAYGNETALGHNGKTVKQVIEEG